MPSSESPTPEAAIRSSRVHVEQSEGVAEIRLARGDKLNAFDPHMFWALAAAGARLRDDPAVRAVVICGEGPAFCAGLDVDSLSALQEGPNFLPFADLTTATHGPANFVQHVVWQWQTFPAPVIAAVHGAAIGAGFQLALAADLRYVAPDAQLAVAETRWGLVPDMGGTLLMRALARPDVVRELTFTGRTFSGRQAMEYGFATAVVDEPRSTALETAREIAARSPDAIREAKLLLAATPPSDVATSLAAEREAQLRLIGGANQREAMAAVQARRRPRFANVARGHSVEASGMTAPSAT